MCTAPVSGGSSPPWMRFAVADSQPRSFGPSSVQQPRIVALVGLHLMISVKFALAFATRLEENWNRSASTQWSSLGLKVLDGDCHNLSPA